MKQYEAMFLFDPTFATDFGPAKAEIERILGRAEAEIVFLERWEERKLAYEIEGRKRGVYVLVYFKCDGAKIVGIERDAQLSEPVLRVLVKAAEGVTRAQIDRFMPHVKRSEDAPAAGAPQAQPPTTERAGADEAAKPEPVATAVAVAEAPEEAPKDAPTEALEEASKETPVETASPESSS